MLSAVAARKAAQAAVQPPQTTVLPSPVPIPSAKPVSKRKASAQTTPTAKKLKKKNKKDDKSTRYFEAKEPLPIHQDIITLDSDPSDSEEDTPARAWTPVDDSSDDESDSPDATNDPSPSTSAPISLQPTFNPVTGQNVFSLTQSDLTEIHLDYLPASLVCLVPGESLSFVGTYKICVLQGSIAILGTILHPHRTPHNVFAPKCSPIPIISALAHTGKSLGIPSRFKALVDEKSIVVVLLELRTGVQGMGRICGTFNGVFNHTNPFDFGIPGMYLVTEPVKNVEPFRLPPSWAIALQDESHNSIVQGAKKSGKSTFARTRVNQLLQRYARVAYLECDLGQSEFTPGGMVALNIIETPLLGPPFCHQSLPLKAHYIGATAPKSSPSHYLSSIQACIEMYRLDIQTPIDDFPIDDDDERITESIPLVVNTMGWTKGLGADLLIKIHDIVQPTGIFEVEAPVYDDYWPPSRPGAGIHRLEPILQLPNAPFGATDLRMLNLLSYFHAIFPPSPSPSSCYRQVTASTWNTSLPLCAQPPYAVDVSLAIDQIILAGVGAEDVVPSEVLGVLNVAVVGLVDCEDDQPVMQEGGLPYVQAAPPPTPTHSTCRGLALIRAVSEHVFHILTPVPSELLGRTRVLVKGEMELPVWGMLDFREEKKEVLPYLQWHKGQGIGAEKRRVRRNLMRRGQA